MAIKIGDPLFNPLGEPGVVTQKESARERLHASSDPAEVKDAFRHGYISGLEKPIRKKFNSVMDEIRQLDRPEEKVENLQKKISDLESETTSPANIQLTHYLRAELFHLMQTYNIHPRQFEVSYHESTNT